MRWPVYFIAFLFVLVSTSFAQSVWDNYRSVESYGPEKEASAQKENVESDNQNEDNESDKPVNRKITYVQNQKQWYVGDLKVTPGAIEALLKTNPEAAVEVDNARTYFIWGMVCAGIGGAALGFGLAEWSDGSGKHAKPITFGGIGVSAVGLILANLSWGRTRAAVEIYNKSLGYNPSMYLSLAPTPQGGLALALSF